MLIYILYRIAHFIALCLPLKAAYCLAAAISDLRYLVARQDRRLIMENLKVIFPGRPKSELRRIRRNLLRNFARHIIDFFYISKINKDFIRKHVRLENSQYLDEALSKAKSAIALTAHIGSWELGGAAMAFSGYNFFAVALPHKNKRENDFFNLHRQAKGIRVITFGKEVRECFRVLRAKQNNVLALLADRNFSPKGIVVDFFGKPTSFPPGPPELAMQTQTPLVPIFLVRDKGDNFVLHFEKPIFVRPGGNIEEENARLVRQYKSIFEDYVRKYPDQWHMFKRFWIE